MSKTFADVVNAQVALNRSREKNVEFGQEVVDVIKADVEKHDGWTVEVERHDTSDRHLVPDARWSVTLTPSDTATHRVHRTAFGVTTVDGKRMMYSWNDPSRSDEQPVQTVAEAVSWYFRIMERQINRLAGAAATPTV